MVRYNPLKMILKKLVKFLSSFLLGHRPCTPRLLLKNSKTNVRVLEVWVTSYSLHKLQDRDSWIIRRKKGSVVSTNSVSVG